MAAVLVISVCVATLAGAAAGFFKKFTKTSYWGVTVIFALLFESIIGAAVKKSASGYGLALIISTVIILVVLSGVFGVLKKLLKNAVEARMQLSHYKNYDDKEENEALILAAVDSGDKKQYKKLIRQGKKIKDSAGGWDVINRIIGAVSGGINGLIGMGTVALCIVLFADLSQISFLANAFSKVLSSGSWTGAGIKLALDLPLTCVISLSIRIGYKSGISTVLSTVVIIGLVIGFGFASWSIASGSVCAGAVESLRYGLLGSLTNTLGDVTAIIAKLIIAGIIFLLSLVVIILVAVFLPKLMEKFRESKVFCTVDGVLGAVVLCVVVTVALMAIGGIAYTLHDVAFMERFTAVASASKLGDAMYACNPMASAFTKLPLRGWFEG